MRIAGIISLDGLSIVLNQGSASAKTTLLAGVPASNITVNLPTVATTLIGSSTTDTLTNKTINATNNTISNLTLAMLAAGVLNTDGTFTGATDAQVPSALAAKTYADSVSAAGLANKITGPASATDNALVRYDLTTGKLAQNSSIVVDDLGNTSGLKTLEIRNDDDLTTPASNMIQLENRNSTSTSHPHIEFRKAGAANANLVNGDEIGGINAHPRHNSTIHSAAEQLAIYTGNGTTRLADWVWKTSNAGAPAERMRITAAGSVQISGLTASMALVTDGSKGLISSATTAAELGYIAGSTGVTGTGAIVRGTSPAITTPTGIVKGDVGLGNVDNTSDATKNAAAVVLTNKDIDGGTASNTSRITVPKATYANLLTLTRKEGTLLYATDLDTFFADDGSTLTAVGSGSGSGSGQLNIVDNPSATSSASTGVTLATNYSAARGTSTSPLAGIIDTCFEISTTTASSETSTSGFYMAGLACPTAIRSTKLQLSMYVIVPASSLGVWRLSVYNSGGTRVSLSSDSSSVTTLPAGFTGQFNCTFDGDTGATYTVSLTQTTRSSANTLYVTNIVIGNGTITQGAAVSNSVAWTPTGSWVTNVTYTGFYRRIGSWAQIEAKVLCSGAPTSAGLTINMPSGMTIDTSALIGTGPTDDVQLGQATILDSGVANYPGVIGYNSTTSVRVFALNASSTYAAPQTVTQALPITFGASDYVTVRFEVPIAEWSGSGTVNLGAGAQVEYASNSDVTVTGSVTVSTSVAGPNGSIVPTGAAATYFTKAVRFQYPIQSDDVLFLEVQKSSGVWQAIETANFQNGLTSFINQNGASYGIGLDVAYVNSTDITVTFGRYAAATGAYSAAGTDWNNAGIQTYRWRVRKAKASSPVGFGLAGTDGSSGLYKAGQAPGLTTGAAIADGYVGEVVNTASALTAGTLSLTTLSNLGNGTLTLKPGVWEIVYDLSVSLTNGLTTSAPNFSEVSAWFIIAQSGTEVDNSGRLLFNREVAVVGVNAIMQQQVRTSAFVNISSATTYTVQGAYSIGGAGTGTASILNSGSSKSRFYARRIA